ncbi:M48 family metallopeptidase [Paracoccaceae bacterium Fryx2]|nr:M48 family metallopeptidase [Paracoccaceae bacterium Fryx2]
MPPPLPAPAAVPAGPLAPSEAARAFIAVVEVVEPVAEAVCRDRTRGLPCDLQIAIDARPGQPPNAFQTRDELGRPIVGFTLSLIADARNADELAFVMGHEAAHHILGHMARQQESAISGAMVAGVLASLGGADAETVRSVQDFGASIGARRFSKTFELEADALGAEIALLAGFDPLRGAAFFDRLPDPGDEFLGTHPPNAERAAVVRAKVATLRGGV